MITVKEYRGHIRNWEELCERLGIDLTLSREEREHEILIKAYQTWGCEMADHMHRMFAFALWDEEEQKLFCLRDQFGTKPFYYYETEDGELLNRQVDAQALRCHIIVAHGDQAAAVLGTDQAEHDEEREQQDKKDNGC